MKQGRNRDYKGKKSVGEKKGKGYGRGKKPFFRNENEEEKSGDFKPGADRADKESKEEKSSYSKEEYYESKTKKQGGFQRFKDDSRPSDFGTAKRKSSADGGFKRNSSSDKPANKKKFGEEDNKKSYDKGNNKTKPFGRKPPGVFGKPKPIVNPYDLDESDLEYGKQKPEYDSRRGRDFKKTPYNKKTFAGKKGSSTPQREVDDGTTRLNKYIANAGICSRREADDLIASGVVQVNGKVITEMGFRVNPTDIIKFGGQTLKKERLVYLILNKPKDYITTLDDEQKRRTVMELVGNACKERIYPVGRLDRNTTGLLMFTNDGELTKKLTHPKFGVKKIYHVELDKPLKASDLKQIEEGIELEDGEIKVDEVSYVGNGEDKTQVGVEIHSGKNRIVRRIFEHFGYNVRKLDRVMFGPLTKKDLPRGRWRLLTESEIGMLKMISQK